MIVHFMSTFQQDSHTSPFNKDNSYDVYHVIYVIYLFLQIIIGCKDNVMHNGFIEWKREPITFICMPKSGFNLNNKDFFFNIRNSF